MENFYTYSIKASGLIALFFLAYYLFIKKETFFTSNRFFLLAGLFTSILLPLLVYTKIVWIAPAPPVEAIVYNRPVILQPEHIAQQQPTFEINWVYVLAGVYCIGVLFFTIRFLIDLFKVTQLLKGKEIKKESRYLLIDSATIQSPFSFFRYIVYNSALLQPNELKNIIAHEKVHSRQLHSLDMLISQLFCLFFWFNPFVWLYKKVICQNLEFIADAEATKEILDVKAYQKTLLKITLQPECIGLTNHFYQSLIKKRIVMLNKQQSKRLNTWKYATVLPALVAFIFLFQIEVVAQEKQPKAPAEKAKTSSKYKISLEVNKDSNEKELNKEKQIFKQEFDADLYFSNITRNNKGEIIAIKVAVKDKDNQISYPVYEVTKKKGDNSPIQPFTVAIEKEEGSDKNLITFNDPIRKEVLNNKVDSVKTAPTNCKEKSTCPKQNIATEGSWSVDSYVKNGDESLIIINGVKQKTGASIKISLQHEVDKVTVLKSKEAIEKYGKEAKYGAMEITTKEHKEATPKNYEVRYRKSFNDEQDSPELYVTAEANRKLNTSITEKVHQMNSSPTRIVELKYESKSEMKLEPKTETETASIKKTLIDQGFNINKAYLSINGKEVTFEEIEKVLDNVTAFKSVSIESGLHEKAGEKYSNKTQNGFLIITTQK